MSFMYPDLHVIGFSCMLCACQPNSIYDMSLYDNLGLQMCSLDDAPRRAFTKTNLVMVKHA